MDLGLIVEIEVICRRYYKGNFGFVINLYLYINEYREDGDLLKIWNKEINNRMNL